MPPLHVVVLNWNGWRDTVECLDSLFASTYPGLRVVLCDNDSSDGSLERICAWADGTSDMVPGAPLASTTGRAPARGTRRPVPYVRYTREEAERGGGPEADAARLVMIQTGANLGYAGGNNVGLRYLLARSDADFVWVLNNDVVVAPDTAQRLVSAASADPRLGAVGGLLLEYENPDRVDTVGGGRVRRWAGFPTTSARMPRAKVGTRGARLARLDFVSGACLMTRVSTLLAIGLIDERYFLYCEDTDWSFRMLDGGLRLACEPEAVLWHKGGGTVVHRSALHDYYIVKSSLLLVHRFNRGWLGAALLYSIWRALLPKIWRAQWRRMFAVLLAYRDFVRQVRSGAEHPAPLPALRGA